MRLIPTFLQRHPDPIVSVTTIKTRVNGHTKNYTIEQTESNNIIVHADIDGRKTVMTLTSDLSKKIIEQLNAMNKSECHHMPCPPVHYPCSDPKLELIAINHFREMWDEYEEAVRKYDKEKEQFPITRNYSIEFFNHVLDPVFDPS
jgi:hypothetical protein